MRDSENTRIAREEMETTLYCAGCLYDLGLLVPAVFVPRTTSEHHAVCCPVAGLWRRTHGGLSHDDPQGFAVDRTGHEWVFDGNANEFRRVYTSRSNGRRVPRWRRFLARLERRWAVWRADTPKSWHSDAVPAETHVLKTFDWQAYTSPDSAVDPFKEVTTDA